MKMQGGRRGESEREEDKIKRGKRPRAAAQKPSGAEQQKKKRPISIIIITARKSDPSGILIIIRLALMCYGLSTHLSCRFIWSPDQRRISGREPEDPEMR